MEMGEGRPSVVGVAWYVRSQYSRVLEVMQDAPMLHREFRDWLEEAEKVVTIIEKAGHLVFKADLDPDRFLQWCKARGVLPDAPNRLRFAAEAAAAWDRGTQQDIDAPDVMRQRARVAAADDRLTGITAA